LATNSNHHYVKCVDIYPQPEPDILLAIGQANGKVVLTTFGPTAFDALGLTGKELGNSHNMNNHHHEILKTYIVFALLPCKLPIFVQEFKLIL
jgi:hypothetical protein